jgi:2-oxoglutarate decarboxylase
VKYHSGAEGLYVARSGNSVTVKLASNPSHLEQVNAVAEGYTRARQSLREGSALTHDPDVAVPLIVHGDAAFTGQGVVAETLNMSALPGYSTGGTIHVIANNQIGFTTDLNEARSTQHPSDLARGFDIPVIHVNADDVDACLAAVRLASAYRDRYKRDVLIDLIGYRRLGHNELDEPAYTQPVMYRTIAEHPKVSQLYAEQLKAEGVVSTGQVDGMISEYESALAEAQAKVAERGSPSNGGATAEPSGRPPTWTSTAVNTAVSAETLRRLNDELLQVPDWMTVHPKLVPQLERRRAAMGPGGGIVWAHAESLALSSLLLEGVPVRLTGQDAERGTFSQRHLVLHDVGEEDEYTPHTGPTYTPIAELEGARSAIEILNSPLSEAAAIGFEYGYSTQLPGALVLWEAQYGDFANGAQIMIDQFLVSGRVKWGERSRLTLLLPHGYEGNGPEHSSARLERFLQLAAEDNIRVANPSTAAQYFHLLRRQALSKRVRPLVVMTPKSLLRLKSASSNLEELSEGAFQAVLPDKAVTAPERVRRLILCSGKIAHELDAAEGRHERDDLAIARVELLYPFPIDELQELLASLPNLQEVTWVQEEPRNMGAWEYMRRNGNLTALLPDGVELTYEGRPRRASTAEGYPQAHQSEQERVVRDAINRS